MNLHELSWPKIGAMPRTAPVVVPIAALEQHGHHLPVFTDSLLLGEVWRRAHERLGDRVLALPLMWLGNSDHHLDFPGTISAPPRVYLDLLGGLIDNLVFHGFTRIVLINGHGGNDVPGRQAIFEARQRYRHRDDLRLVFTTYWGLGARPWEANPQLVQREMGHACEWETSMILRLAPQLVGDYRAAADVAFDQPFAPAHVGWITKDRSSVGHIGSPRLASAEKGETLFEAFSQDIVKLLEQILEADSHHA